MRQGQWQDAEASLQEAYEKDGKNPDTLANLVTVSLHLAKNTSRYTRFSLVVLPVVGQSVA